MHFNTLFNISKYTFSISLSLDKVFLFKILATKTPNKESYGITSRCLDGKHVLFFDFDGLSLQEVKEECIFLQAYYSLSALYIFENDRPDSFHIICLDKFKLYEAIEIISNSSADKGFKRAPLLFKKRRWVLRISSKGTRKKPVYISKIDGSDSKRQISTAHRIFLNKYYNTGIEKSKYEDNLNDSIDICEYNTAANC